SDVEVGLDVDDFPIAGDVELFVLVDSDLEISESDESDNLSVLPVYALALPDLVVDTGAITLIPSSPVPGQPVEIRVGISNTGEQSADPAPVKLYLRSGQASVEISPEHVLPALPAAASGEVSWS